MGLATSDIIGIAFSVPSEILALRIGKAGVAIGNRFFVRGGGARGGNARGTGSRGGNATGGTAYGNGVQHEDVRDNTGRNGMDYVEAHAESESETRGGDATGGNAYGESVAGGDAYGGDARGV
ncbi:hypothetical protein N431DRAFT_556393 [Stipitochalara longipes BDJ]|nr:hypothetical protein N431DRAFT_556393 [Stipitochalara longipes BDJ]